MSVGKSMGYVVALTAGMMLAGSQTASAQEKEVKLKVIAKNLDNPCGIAVQPGTGDLLVSSNKRVVRIPAAGGGKRSVEIAGFPTDVYGKGPKYDISALGLAFLDKDTLVAGDGGFVDGKELVRFFNIGSTAKEKGKALKYTDTTATSGPIEPGSDSEKGEGNFYGIAIKDSNIYVTCNGDDTKGWVSKIEVKDGKPGPLTPFIKSKVETEVDAPTGITISPEGELVISQLGEINVPGDSLLTYYDAKSGKLLKKLSTGLFDLDAVAYSPKTGKLYGLDFAWMAPDKAGLFLLEPESENVKVTKLASVDKPSAMAFGEDGTLYITALGTAEEKTEAEKAEQDAKAKKGRRFPGMVLSVKGL